MIDIHCHLLPFVDYDGPQTLEESLEMLECAEKEGVKAIIATPHVTSASPASRRDEIRDAFVLLKENAGKEHLSVELRLGAEIYMSPDLHDFVRSGNVSLDSDGRHVLVELPMHEIPPYAQPQLLSLVSEGITPVVAHPERNLRIVRDYEILFLLSRAGILFQVNSGSLLGHFGKEVKKTANSILSSGLCHFVASDAHNSGSRGFSVKDTRVAVEKILGRVQAKAVLEDNPAGLL